VCCCISFFILYPKSSNFEKVWIWIIVHFVFVPILYGSWVSVMDIGLATGWMVLHLS